MNSNTELENTRTISSLPGLVSVFKSIWAFKVELLVHIIYRIQLQNFPPVCGLCLLIIFLLFDFSFYYISRLSNLLYNIRRKFKNIKKVSKISFILLIAILTFFYQLTARLYKNELAALNLKNTSKKKL